jgi:hypothetical protein
LAGRIPSFASAFSPLIRSAQRLGRELEHSAARLKRLGAMRISASRAGCEDFAARGRSSGTIQAPNRCLCGRIVLLEERADGSPAPAARPDCSAARLNSCIGPAAEAQPRFWPKTTADEERLMEPQINADERR